MSEPTPPPMPGWVKGMAIAVGLFVVLFAILHFTGVTSGHGPSMHA